LGKCPTPVVAAISVLMRRGEREWHTWQPKCHTDWTV
jgi:hypothetical protein